MAHIRQKNTIGTDAYTVVMSTGYGGENQPPLDEHPAIVEHPEMFEVTTDEIPEQHQYLRYSA